LSRARWTWRLRPRGSRPRLRPISCAPPAATRFKAGFITRRPVRRKSAIAWTKTSFTMGLSMDMSDNIAAQPADELARDRERLKAEDRQRSGAGLGGFTQASVGRKLKLMFGAAAAAAVVLGCVALIGLSQGGGDGVDN